MADHTPSPPQDTFSTIAEGYGGAQQTLARLGFLPGAMPGSFSPSDRNGTAVQFPTPPPPRFPTVVSTTLPFPAAVPQFAGAVSPQPPSVLPPMFSTPQPTFTQGMPSANYSPQAPSYAPAMAPQAAPYPFGVPIAAPNWTRAFTQPTQGFGHPGEAFGGGTLLSDAVQAGYIPRPMFMQGPGAGVNIMQQRAGAGLRMNQRFEDWGASAISGASIGIGAIGGAAALGIGGATLGGIASAAGLIAAPMMAASAWTGAYQDERAGTRAVQNVFSGMSMGPMMSPLGQGINPMAARQIQNRFKESTRGGDFTSGDMFSTMGMAQESGLMRGHTNSVDQVVTRVKELAKVTKSIMDLGQGITQQDAIELQAIASNMGIGTSQFASQGIGKKLVTAARVTGQTVQDVMSGVGASGASLFAQAGMNAGSGMMVGVHTAGVSAGMVNSGMFSPRELSALGGESGIQNTMAQGIARFQAQNAGNMMRGMLTGPDALHAMQTGTLSMADASKQGGAIFKDQNLTKQQRKLAAQFFDEAAPDMLSDMQSKMTPERMQAMQIAQAASLMRDSKGTMTANTAFTKVTGSEEGAKVLMKLMEHPEILRSQSAQASLVRMEEVNRGAANWDVSQGPLTKLGDWVSGGVSSLKKSVGIGRAADWASERDFQAEAEAAGVDPSKHRRRYKNLVNSTKMIDDVSSGRKTLESILAQQDADSMLTRRVEGPSERDPRFAADALENMGLDVGGNGSWDFLSGSGIQKRAKEERWKRVQAELKDQQDSVVTMDAYSRYSESPDAAAKFLESQNTLGGTKHDVGRVLTKLASTVSGEVLADPTNVGKILSTSKLRARMDAALADSGIRLNSAEKASYYSDGNQTIGAHLAVATQGNTELENAAKKALSLTTAVKNADGGYVDADLAAEDYAKKEVNGESVGFIGQYVRDQRSFFGGEDDDAATAGKFTRLADLAAGADLREPDEMKMLVSTGGSRQRLQDAASGKGGETERQRAIALKIMKLNKEKHSDLFAGASEMRGGMATAARGGDEQSAFADAANTLSGIVKNTAEKGANNATYELMSDAGLMVGGATSPKRALEIIQERASEAKAMSGRELAKELLGPNTEIGGASWDKMSGDWNEAASKIAHGVSKEEREAIVQKLVVGKLSAAQKTRDGAGAGPTAEGPGGSVAAAIEVSAKTLQEMQATNKKLFDSLGELTGKSQKTVESMTAFIAAVETRLTAGGL